MISPLSLPPFEPWRGVFETLRVSGGLVRFQAAHLAEFQRACAALDLPCDFSPATAAATLPPEAEGRWRWLATPSGVTHFFTREAPRPRARRFPLLPATARLGSANLDARFKTLSYLTHAQAAAENPAGEVVLLNEHGQIASAARANLFWLARGQLFTPALECGCRRGVIRAWVLAQRAVEEVAADLTALDAADEIFLTNSLRGLQPVTHWRSRPLGPALQTAQLRRLFRVAAE